MSRLKGPQLNLSELKVPPLLRDLYWDLRDRRLLPLIGLLALAIVATPFLLGSGSEPAVEPIGPAAAGAGRESASLTVLPAEPGLREPSKRLAGLAPKDPFRPHYTAPVFNQGAAPTSKVSTSGGSGGASVEVPTEGGSSGGGSTPSPEPTPAPEPAPPPGGEAGGHGGGSGQEGGSGSGGSGQIQLFTFAIDVKIAHTERTKGGAMKMGKPVVRHEVVPTAALPGAKAPVLTYLGVDVEKAKKALMLVSPEVSSVFGDAKCLSGTSSCQLLALEPGLPEVLEYGPGGARYKFEVLKIEPVKTGTVAAPRK